VNRQPAETLESTRVPHRVLVVDDDEVIRSLVRDGLEREGFEVCLAGDGESALRILGDEAPDLVILDVTCRPLAASTCSRRSATRAGSR
jgi:DNA-binding response OmpR family regulator